MGVQNRIGGTIYVRVNGAQLRAKGNWEFDLGFPKRDPVLGAADVHGYSEKTKAPYIKGAISDESKLDYGELCLVDGATITLELANGKVVSLFESWFSGDGKVTTEEGEMEVEYTGLRADVITP